MVELNSLSAWVAVDGADLPEHEPQLDFDAKQVVCWIPSMAGKEFTVCWRDPVGLVGNAGYLTVDGMFCGAKHMYSSVQRPYGRVDTVRKGLDLTDDELYLDLPASPHLGEIRLDIFEVNITGATRFVQPGMPPDTQLLHERTKKAMEHRVKLGHETSCHEKKFASIEKIRLLSTFIFRYRPIEILMANGIARNICSKRKFSGRYRNSEIIDVSEDVEGNDDKRVKVEVKAEVKTEVKTEWVKPEVRS